MRCSECGRVSAINRDHIVVCEHILAKIRDLYEETHVAPKADLPITLAGMPIYLHENAPQEHGQC